MALWFQLKVNTELLGTVEIRRCTTLDLADPAAIADVISTYTVRRDTAYVGTVQHRYGDGAWKLLAAVTSLLAEDGRPELNRRADEHTEVCT